MTCGCVQRCVDHYAREIGWWNVLELGPYNGRNTVHLAPAARCVVALEPRPENCLATARAMSGRRDWALLRGRADDLSQAAGFDLLFHCGVLYHLADPVAHWRSLAGRFRRVWLNTHYALEGGNALRGFVGQHHGEPVDKPRAGLDRRSFWLTRASLLRLVGEAFEATITWEEVDHPNGPRIELCCER